MSDTICTKLKTDCFMKAVGAIIKFGRKDILIAVQLVKKAKAEAAVKKLPLNASVCGSVRPTTRKAPRKRRVGMAVNFLMVTQT